MRCCLLALCLATGCAPTLADEYAPCSTSQDCRGGQACAPLRDGPSVCRSACDRDEDCQTFGSRPSTCSLAGSCFLRCEQTVPSCPAPLACESGYCVAARVAP